MNKEELIKGSREVFDANPGTIKLLATSDGSYFLPSAKNLAVNHKNEHGLELHEINASDMIIDKIKAIKVKAPEGEKGKDSDGVSSAPEVEKDLGKMNKVELQQKATQLGLTFTEENTKAELIDLIEGSK